MKRQVLAIHGGDTFATYEDYMKFLSDFDIGYESSIGRRSWRQRLPETLGDDFEVSVLQMPNPTNAVYVEWELWFNKYVPHLRDGVVFVGHSLGGAFLAKYLTLNKLPVKIGSVHLVAPVFDVDTDNNGLHSFSLPETLNLQTEKVFLYHSVDDSLVAYESVDKFFALLPYAQVRRLEGRGHINQSEFPELVADIRSLQ